ncbi:hypothetical protein KAU33_09100 [Candidatus Dependentiae bacterium]|nr:hypothetical protein [Candidatus Dependentiae bacterium]
MSEFKRCPVCKKVMQLLVNPKTVPENPDKFIYDEHMFYECYFCGTKMDLCRDIIFKKSSDKTKKCPRCGTKMKTFIYPKNADSPLAGKEFFVCNLCNTSENVNGGRVPYSLAGGIFRFIAVNSIKIVDDW